MAWLWINIIARCKPLELVGGEHGSGEAPNATLMPLPTAHAAGLASFPASCSAQSYLKHRRQQPCSRTNSPKPLLSFVAASQPLQSQLTAPVPLTLHRLALRSSCGGAAATTAAAAAATTAAAASKRAAAARCLRPPIVAGSQAGDMAGAAMRFAYLVRLAAALDGGKRAGLSSAAVTLLNLTAQPPPTRLLPQPNQLHLFHFISRKVHTAALSAGL